MLLTSVSLLTSGALLAPRVGLVRPATMRASSATMCDSGFYSFTARSLDESELVPLSNYAGKVSLVVNVASK